MICPIHKINLIPTRNRFSYVCPQCQYKIVNPSKLWVPEMRHVIEVPAAFAFSTFTVSDITVSGSTLVLTTGKTTGYAVTPQILNLTRKSTRYWDCTKVKLNWTHSSIKIGDIKYYASNDGGIGYRIIKTSDAVFQLNRGNELRQYKQAKYNDLRIKIVLDRTLASDTSPSVSKVIINYNKVNL